MRFIRFSALNQNRPNLYGVVKFEVTSYYGIKKAPYGAFSFAVIYCRGDSFQDI